MNELAVRLEEQIISLFSSLETEIYQGWVLKETSFYIVIYPLYGSPNKDIVEHTNYHLAARLEDCGYKMQNCCIVAEYYMNESDFSFNRNFFREIVKPKVSLSRMAGTNITENVVTNNGTVIGIKRQKLLYLPNGRLPCDVEIGDIFQFATKNQISKILVNISETEELLAYYEKAGFHKAYYYHCYQKEDLLSGFTE